MDVGVILKLNFSFKRILVERMKEIKREVTTEQVVYEITKEELDSIKREERNKGRDDVL